MSKVFALLLDDALLKICAVTEVVLFSIVAFKTMTFHTVVLRQFSWGVVGSLVALLLQMFSWFWQWNKFEHHYVSQYLTKLRRTEQSVPVCQVLHKCHSYHAILHKLYTWFGKNQLRLYLNGAKKISIRGGWGAAPAAPCKYAHDNTWLMSVLIAMAPSTYTPRSVTYWTGWIESLQTSTTQVGIWWSRRDGAHQTNAVFAGFTCSLLLRVQLQTSSMQCDVLAWSRLTSVGRHQPYTCVSSA